MQCPMCGAYNYHPPEPESLPPTEDATAYADWLERRLEAQARNADIDHADDDD